jgi:hypothetical protein
MSTQKVKESLDWLESIASDESLNGSSYCEKADELLNYLKGLPDIDAATRYKIDEVRSSFKAVLVVRNGRKAGNRSTLLGQLFVLRMLLAKEYPHQQSS